MPIYEYECTHCGRIEEAFQSFSDEPLTTCGSCGGTLQKLISMSSFHLKGSGWYVTDYAGKNKNTAPPKAKADDTAAAKETSPSKTDSSSD